MYLDFTSVKRSGHVVRIAALQDFISSESGEERRYQSVVFDDKYACQSKRLRTLEVTFFAGNLGALPVVARQPGSGEWYPVAAGSITELIGDSACRQR